MKNVTRLVTEDPINKDKNGDPKWVFNDYMADTLISVNNLQKPASEALVDDTISQGKVIKVITFEYNDDENPQVLAA
jgi:hypothetical protein